MNPFTNLDFAMKVAAISRGTREHILQYYAPNTNAMQFTQKEDGSPLTLADTASHNYLCEKLTLLYDIPIVSEEGETAHKLQSNLETFWLIDPLDGTKEFLAGSGEFTANIALIHQGISILGAVYAPVIDKTWFGNILLGSYCYQNSKLQPVHCKPRKNTKDISVAVSRQHNNKTTEDAIAKLRQSSYNVERKEIGSSLKFCLLAEGEVDLYPRFGLTSQWDTAAGQAVLNAAGGSVLNLSDGQVVRYGQVSTLNGKFLATSRLDYAEILTLMQSIDD